MSEMSMVRRCYSCGAILQSEDKDAEGYIKPEVLNQEHRVGEVYFCDKCYTEQSYSLTPTQPSLEEGYLSMLEDAQASDALIVYVIDAFSFEASFVKEVAETIQGLPILVIANKRDLLPKSVKDETLKIYFAHRFRASGIYANPEDVVLTTLSSNSDVLEIAKMIEERRRRHDVYIIGASGAGKTFFLNAYLRSYKNSSSQEISLSNYPGTDLRVMQIPLDNSSMMYDTPGIPTDNSVTSRMDSANLRVAYPSTPVKARLLSFIEKDAVAIGGLAIFELLKGERTAVKFYGAEGLTLKKKQAEKLSPIFFKGLEKGDLKPAGINLKDRSDFDAFDIVVEEKGPRDIGIEGLGWFAFEGKSQTFRVIVPKGVSIYTSRAKIK